MKTIFLLALIVCVCPTSHAATLASDFNATQSVVCHQTFGGVGLSAQVRKELYKLPQQIQRKFDFWTSLIATHGIQEVRKIPGFHDEPLHGYRSGQRSVRLSRAYRAIYRVVVFGGQEMIQVDEINKHEY